MTEQLQATVPAQSGWYVARFFPSNRDSLNLEPIIAWQIWREDDPVSFNWVAPITLAGRQQLNHSCLIKSPGGNFVEDGTVVCDDEESALRLLRAHYDQERREAAE
jgi:hypothetical protein